MANPSERNKNNFKAGAFILASLILLIAVIVILAPLRKWFESGSHYQVEFPITSGVNGMNAGSSVLIGGVSVGEIEAVKPNVLKDGQLKTITVSFEVYDTSIKLYRNAKIHVTSPLIGSSPWLSITDTGSETSQDKDPQYASIPITGTATGMLDNLLGASGASALTESLVNIEKITAELAVAGGVLEWALGQPGSADVEQMLKSLRSASDEADQMLAELLSSWSGWDKDVSVILSDARTLVANFNTVLATNESRINSLISNTDDITAQINEAVPGIRKQLTDLLGQGDEAMHSANEVLTQVQNDYQGWAIDIGELLANLSLSGQQLKLATVEIRNNPWKILYRPEAKEMQHELLYETVRQFAFAAADLKASAQSLERLQQKGDAEAIENDPTTRRLMENLSRSASQYEKVQEQLLNVLLVDIQEKKK
jgi:ABC-type transporter Mla subunit MlaD